MSIYYPYTVLVNGDKSTLTDRKKEKKDIYLYVGDKNIDYFVCECSSFQLEYSPTFTPQIAVFTNLTPDHIDWHNGVENYFKAKARLFKEFFCRGTVYNNFFYCRNFENLRQVAYMRVFYVCVKRAFDFTFGNDIP